MKPRLGPRLVLLLLLFVSSGVLKALQPSYLDDFPTPERVLAATKGTDERDTQAKQVGALRQLWEMIAILARGRKETADETRLRQRYNVAQGQIDAGMMATFNADETARLGLRSPRAKWVALCALYESDEALHAQLIEQFFSPTFRATHAKIIRNGMTLFRHSPSDFRQKDSGALMQSVEDLPWYKGPATLLAVLTVISLLLVFRYLLGELRSFTIDPAHPRRLQAGRRFYELETVTGIVADQQKLTITETTTIKREDPSNITGSSSTSVTKRSRSHRFNLLTPDGKATLLWLDHHKLESENGQRVSAIKFRPIKKEWGDYLVYLNHSTGERTQDSSRLHKLFRPRYGLLWRLPLAILFLELYVQAHAAYPANQHNFPTLFDYSGSIFLRALEIWTNWIDQTLRYWISGLLGGLILISIIASLRTRRFLNHGCKALFAELKAEARQQAGDGFDGSPISRAG